jgi:hypothetical protein
MNDIKKKFSIAQYKSLLSYFIKSKLKFKKFDDDLTKGKNIIMRHDVDFCPLRALEMAKIEHKFKIPATYFFLINTNFYNLNTTENKKIITEMINIGHEIGLHFDASFFKERNSMDLKCKEELEALEKIAQKKINIVSFHRPAKKILIDNKKIANKDHTYMLKFIKKINYCSDSQGEWRFKTPKEIIEKKINQNFTLHLLTHPIWWTTPEKYTSGEKVDFYLKKKYKDINILAAHNCKPFSTFIKNKNKL